MTDWPAIIALDFAVPAGRAPREFLGELFDALGSPDPVLRDDQAYPVLATWIISGKLDDDLAAIGERSIAQFGHPELQARTFAALIGVVVVDRDAKTSLLDAATVLRWRDQFARWWLAETDLRGWDGELGWLHAAAHGADLAGAFGLSPRLDSGELVSLLQTTAARLLTPTDHVFAHQEDDRIALALASMLSRPEFSADQATAWLDPIGGYFDAAQPGPVPAPAINTMRTLRSLYVMADRGFRLGPDSDPIAVPHRTQLLASVGELLHAAFPPQA